MSCTISRRHSWFRRVSDRFALELVLAVLQQDCRDDPAVGLAQKSVTGYKDVAQQPVSIPIEADQSSFQSYSTCVLTASCGTKLDQCVLAVGNGINADRPVKIQSEVALVVFHIVMWKLGLSNTVKLNGVAQIFALETYFPNAPANTISRCFSRKPFCGLVDLFIFNIVSTLISFILFLR